MTIARHRIEHAGENDFHVVPLSPSSLSRVLLLSIDALRYHFARHDLRLGILSDQIPSERPPELPIFHVLSNLNLPRSHVSDAVIEGKILFDKIFCGRILLDQFRGILIPRFVDNRFVHQAAGHPVLKF
jgi:hypothetical protein